MSSVMPLESPTSEQAADAFKGTVEPDGGVHQADVGERLREVAQQPPGDGVVLLRQQADVVAQGQQALEQRRAPRRAGP